jgi:hypothetical protein
MRLTSENVMYNLMNEISYCKGRYQRILIYNKTHHYSTLSNLALIKHGALQSFICDPLLFLVHINDLPQFMNNKSAPFLFADDTYILFTHSNTTEFNSNSHTV